MTTQARDVLVRLESAHSGYGFTAEVKRLRKRLDDLLDGADVLVYRSEIPADMATAAFGWSARLHPSR